MTLFLSFEKTQPCSSRKLIVAASDVQLFLKYSSIISFVGYQVKKGDRVSVCSGRVRRVCLLAIVVAILSVPTFAAHYITFRAGLFDCLTNRARARRFDQSHQSFDAHFLADCFLNAIKIGVSIIKLTIQSNKSPIIYVL